MSSGRGKGGGASMHYAVPAPLHACMRCCSCMLHRFPAPAPACLHASRPLAPPQECSRTSLSRQGWHALLTTLLLVRALSQVLQVHDRSRDPLPNQQRKGQCPPQLPLDRRLQARQKNLPGLLRPLWAPCALCSLCCVTGEEGSAGRCYRLQAFVFAAVAAAGTQHACVGL